MKKTVIILVLGMLLSVFASGCGAATGTQETSTGAPASFTEKEPESYKGSITMLTLDGKTDTAMAAEFNKKFPNIKVKIVPIPDGGDYSTKLSSMLASGSGIPDVVTLEYSILGKFINTDQFEILGEAPFNGNQYKDNMVEYMFNYGKNAKGQQVGMPVDPAPAGLFYRKDIVKQYLGTDDSAELAEMMPTWDKFLEQAKIIKEKSGGKVYALSSADLLYPFIAKQTGKPWIDEKLKVSIETLYLDAMKTTQKFVEADVFAKIKTWEAPWYASFSQGNIAFYPEGLWLEGFVIKDNDKDGARRWGVTKTPGGCLNSGGVNLAIPKGSENKELAWQFIKWYTTTEEAAVTTRKTAGGLTAWKPAYENPIYHEADDFMGGFKTAEFFINEADTNMKVPPVSQYDPILTDVTNKYMTPFAEGTATAEETLKKITDEVLTMIPESSR